MDVFSLGCVIAEIFLEGSSIFTLAQLFKYKKGEYKPPLDDIEDESIRDLVKSMISLDPNDRLSAEEYLLQWRNKSFPDYFYFLHGYIENITKPLQTVGNVDRARQVESDQRIEMIWKNYSTIGKELGLVTGVDGGDANDDNNDDYFYNQSSLHNIIPVCLDLPGMKSWIPRKRKTLPGNHDDGALIIVAIVCSAIRNTSRSSSKIKGCDLLLALGEQIHDEAKFDRCLPHLMSLLDDSSDIVQVAALRSLTQLLNIVGAITPLNDKIFPEYIFPRLTSLLQDNSSVIIKSAYGCCLPVLATIASKFLDMSQILKTTGIMNEEDPETENDGTSIPVDEDQKRTYDVIKRDLSLVIEEHARTLLTDSNPDIRRSLLRHIVPLCLFLGKQKTNDVILSHAITYLNDSNVQLRMQLFDSIVGLAPYVGSISLKEYVTPLMMQSLTDPEELVVNKVIQAFTALSDLGLLEISYIWELLRTCSKFMVHPNNWIRNSTFCLFSSTTRWMVPAQIYCILWPIIQPFMECDINDFSASSLMINVKAPFPREIYNLTATWATKAQRSLFWKVDNRSKGNNSGGIKDKPIDLSEKPSRKVVKNRITSEDDQWLTRLRQIGMKEDHLWILALYKEYIFRVFRSRSRRIIEKNNQTDESLFINLQEIGVLPQNVFFESTPADDGFTELSMHNTNPDKLKSNTSPLLLGDQHFESTRLLTATEIDQSNSAADSKWKALIMAHPVTGTIFTDVYGELDNQSSSSSRENLKYSTYNGDNPYIWKLLGSVYKETIIVDSPEFGAKCVPYDGNGSIRSPKKRKGKPLGILASNFEDHNGAINAIAVSPDHSFFVSASDDGTVKVWDCFRLEKNVINKSVREMNFRAENSDESIQVKCICFIENTYSFACGTTDGNINIIRVETQIQNSSTGPRYRPLVKLNGFKLNDGESAISIHHAKTNSSSSLLYVLTTDSRLVVYDLILKTQISIMENPSSHGIPTCFVVDKYKNWILIGTSRGIVDLWDIRFQVHIRSFGIPGGQPINSLALHSNPKVDGKWVCISGGTIEPEITVWDIETFECREIYRTSYLLSSYHNEGDVKNISKINMKNYIPIDFDKSMNGMTSLTELISELGMGADNGSSGYLRDFPTKIGKDSILSLSSGYEIENTNSSSIKRGYLITGGTDKILRFWDLNNFESSTIVSGLKNDATYQPSYVVSYPQPNTKLVTERLVSNVSTPTTPHKNNSKKQSKERLPRSTVISYEQLDLSRNHQASILSVALIFKPYEMIISGDRLGTIKVYV